MTDSDVVLQGLRRFTDDGVKEVQRCLDEIESGANPDLSDLVVSDDMTVLVDPAPAIEIVPFSDRRHAAEHIRDIYHAAGLSWAEVKADVGLWTWLAVAWIDQLAPTAANGRRKLRERARWVLQPHAYTKYYRHLLAGPCMVLEAHSDDPSRAMALLANPVNQFGEVVEQFASRQFVVQSKGLTELVTRLYYQPESSGLRRGAGGKGAGSARRLAELFLQLDLTWDLQGATADDLVGLLPNEFDRFRADNG